MLELQTPPADQTITGAAPVVIGRSRSADIVLQDEFISGKHVRVTLLEDSALIEDLDSRNGTRVNGEPITEPTEVMPGDRVGIGDSEFVLRRL